MYIKITTRCNMSCSHCGMNCTAKGIDMTPKIYKKAIKFSTDLDDAIMLGGGEPTLHKHFWEFIGLALGSADNVWLATNGSITNTSLRLASLAKMGVIGCALSQDIYHDPIDDEVVEAFSKKNNYGYQHYSPHDLYDLREIRDVTNKEIQAGRCEFGKEECICDGLIIEPDGEIKACGCFDAPSFGTIFNPDIPEEWNTFVCYKKQDEKLA